MARRYFARYASKRLGGLLKDSALRPLYRKSQEVVEKSRNVITYDPAENDPKEVWFEADISFGLDAGRRFQPVVRVGEHFRFYADLIDGKALLETEWSY